MSDFQMNRRTIIKRRKSKIIKPLNTAPHPSSAAGLGQGRGRRRRERKREKKI